MIGRPNVVTLFGMNILFKSTTSTTIAMDDKKVVLTCVKIKIKISKVCVEFRGEFCGFEFFKTRSGL